MSTPSNQSRAVTLLQELGFKEYEARAFVALSRCDSGTAKEISEISEVPRTRVYDAIRVLEQQGLVEVQQSTPKQFRAVSPDEAVHIIEQQYAEKIASFHDAITGMSPVDDAAPPAPTYDVWTLSGGTAITSRAHELIGNATDEVILVLGHASVFTEALVDKLQAATDAGVRVAIGAVTEELAADIRTKLSEVEVFVSGLNWLAKPVAGDDDTEISRLLLVDGKVFLVSTFLSDIADARHDEKAIFSRGFDNGFVAIARRLLSTGLVHQLSAPNDDTPPA